MTTETAPFAALPSNTLYDILRLRSEVFVVEQDCVYQDIDGIDLRAWHSWQTVEGHVVACARLFVRDERQHIAQIGRVVVAQAHRHEGRASAIMQSLMHIAKHSLKASSLYLEAQAYAIPFYEQLGFRVCSGEFLEDGIPHVKMEQDI